MGVNAERVWRDNREEGRKTEKRKDIEKDTARAPARGRKQKKENQDFCAPYESTKYFLLCRESKKDVLPAREIAWSFLQKRSSNLLFKKDVCKSKSSRKIFASWIVSKTLKGAEGRKVGLHSITYVYLPWHISYARTLPRWLLRPATT